MNINYNVHHSDIIWGYLSQFFNIASNILLLPFILIYLSSEEIGIWYVFITIISFIQLLEFGFLPTISRYISYIYSGASSIDDNIKKYKNNNINIKLLSSTIYSAQKIYFAISMVSLIFILSGGLFYISTLNYTGEFVKIYISWIIYGTSTVILFYFGYYNAILKGRGDQTSLNKTIVISKISNISICIPLLIMGSGILSISIGVLVSVFIDRILVRKAVFNKKAIETIAAFNMHSHANQIKTIWSKAKLMGIVQIGNFMTTKCSLLIVSSIIGLEAAASYGFTLQLTNIAIVVSSMYFGLQMPRLSAEYITGNLSTIRSIFIKSIGISWYLFILYSLSLLYIGPIILSIISENTKLLPTAMLAIFLVSSFLEMNYSQCTAYLTTKNDITFAYPIFITGTLIVLCSYILSPIYGLWGVISSQFILQFLYNNWKWPTLVFHELKITWKAPFLIILK